MKLLPVKTMSKSDQGIVGEWVQEHRKNVRQLTIRQTNTKHGAGTLPLNMYRKELAVGERIPKSAHYSNHSKSDGAGG